MFCPCPSVVLFGCNLILSTTAFYPLLNRLLSFAPPVVSSPSFHCSSLCASVWVWKVINLPHTTNQATTTHARITFSSTKPPPLPPTDSLSHHRTTPVLPDPLGHLCSCHPPQHQTLLSPHLSSNPPICHKLNYSPHPHPIIKWLSRTLSHGSVTTCHGCSRPSLPPFYPTSLLS